MKKCFQTLLSNSTCGATDRGFIVVCANLASIPFRNDGEALVSVIK
jgi:hypothetical protein